MLSFITIVLNLLCNIQASFCPPKMSAYSTTDPIRCTFTSASIINSNVHV